MITDAICRGSQSLTNICSGFFFQFHCFAEFPMCLCRYVRILSGSSFRSTAERCEKVFDIFEIWEYILYSNSNDAFQSPLDAANSSQFSSTEL